MDSTLVLEESEESAIIQVLAVVLERLVGANSHLSEKERGQVTKFSATVAPDIGIGQYLERIHTFASCSNECFILALIFIDRLIRGNNGNNFILTELNVHRVVITAVLLAAKSHDDSYYNNAYYARIGGLVVPELNSLEIEFLFRINFSLRVGPQEFEQYHSELKSNAYALGLLSPPFLQLEAEQCINQLRISSVDEYSEAEPPASQELRVQPEIYSATPMTHTAFYQDQHIGVNTSLQTYQNPSQITPSPPPQPSHHHGNFAGDLAGAMYEPYSAHHHQVPPHFFHQHATDASEMLLKMPEWPQVNTVTSAVGATLHHYQGTSCSHPSEGRIAVPQHQSNVMGWQMHQSDYSVQHFASNAESEHLRNVAHYANYSQVES
jgi:hypothetical protein